MDSAADAMDDMADAAKSAGEAVGQIGSDSGNIAGVGTEASKAGTEVNNLNEKTNTLGETFKKLAGIVGGLAIANKIKQYGEDSLESYKSFESGMAEVNSLLPDATKAQMDELGEGAREIAKSTGAEISDVTSAMYQAISASVPQDQVLGFLETAEKAATGGVSDMETAVDAITSVTNAYGTDTISATEASDKMFSAVKLGKTTFDELAGSLYNVVPTAVGAGVSFDDITGALAAMTAQGVPTSVATTQLRQAIVELSDSGSNTGKKFKELAGTGFRDFIAQGHNLSDAFKIMQAEADKTGVGVNELFSSVEAGNAVLSLSGDHAQLFKDDIAAMQDSAGATDTAYSKMADTMEYKTNKMKAQFEDIKTSAGEALAGGIDAISQYISDNTEGIRTTVVEFFKGVGDLMGKLAPMIPGILKGLTGIASGFTKAITPILDFATTHPEFIETALGAITAAVTTFKFADMDWSKSGIGKMLSFITANPTIAGITAAAAGVTALSIALDNLHQKEIDTNIQEHFGSITLTDDQINDLVPQVIDIPYTANMEEVEVQFANADQAKTDAEEALSQMHTLDWKVSSLHLDLSETEGQSLIDNMNQFKESVETYMTSSEAGAEGTVQGLLGSKASADIIADMSSWFSTDKANVDQLSEALTTLITTAVNDGTYNVDTATAAQILEAKIQEMSGMAQDALLDAQFETLQMQYSGAALDPDTWSRFLKAGHQYVQDSQQKEFDDIIKAKAQLNVAEQNDPSRKPIIDQIKALMDQAYNDQNANALGTEMSNFTGSIETGYQDELANASSNLESTAGRYLPDLQNAFSNYGAGTISEEEMKNRIFGTNQALSSYQTVGLTQEDQEAINQVYQSLAPTGADMQKVIDEAQKSGQAVPEAFMDSYREYMKLGAAAGDENATWGYMADQLVQSGGYDDFMKTVQDSGYKIPEAFQEALKRANVDTRDTIGDDIVTGIGDAVQGANWDNVKDILHNLNVDMLDSAGTDFNSMSADEIAKKYLQIGGMTQTSADESAGTVTYTLDADVQTVWSVAGKVIEAGGGAGLSQSELTQKILEANGFTEDQAQHLDVGQQIVVPEEYVIDPNVDSSQAGQAVQDATTEAGEAAQQASESNPVPVEQKYTVEAQVDTNGVGGTVQSATTEAGEAAQQASESNPVPVEQKYTVEAQVDASGVGEAVQSASASAAGSAGGDTTVNTNTTNNVTTTTNVTNAADAAQETHDQLQATLDTPTATTGSTNVTVSQTNNAADVYSQVVSDLQSQFSNSISVGAHATVNMSWGITNASKTITLSGASGGSFTITAHKFGGYFTEPHIGMVAEAGPEWVIPDNGSAESAEMVMEAAQSIIGSGDITGNSGKVMPDMASYLGQAGGASGGKSEKEITININGSGSISASGMSREQVVEVLEENLRPVLLSIVSTEDAEEGMMAYEY